MKLPPGLRITPASSSDPTAAAFTVEVTSIIHQCPPRGSGVMPCCGRTPFEVPRTDRMTIDGIVTCNASSADTEQERGRALATLWRIRMAAESWPSDAPAWQFANRIIVMAESGMAPNRREAQELAAKERRYDARGDAP